MLSLVSPFPEPRSPFLKVWPGDKVRAEKETAGGGGSGTHLLKDDINVTSNELCDLLPFGRLYGVVAILVVAKILGGQGGDSVGIHPGWKRAGQEPKVKLMRVSSHANSL